MQELNLRSYSISLSTLEDVFLKIGQLENPLNIIELLGTTIEKISSDFSKDD